MSGRIPYQRTTHAVWELTLQCNLACSHCGSRAGEAREGELDTVEALDLVRQLAEVGIREVTLIGGEAYLRRDWLTIARAIRDAGMIPTMVTGGLGISAALAARMAEAGIESVSLSIDGLEETHDALRGVPGSFAAAFRALSALREAGLQTSVNTQINRRTQLELEALYERIRAEGVHSWQLQLTVPMGNAADDEALLLQPADLLPLFPRLAALAERGLAEGLRLRPGNNLGYYGPHEALLRGAGDPEAYWTGCQAGTAVLGIEADGAIKGCPSLPTAPYTGGNVRETRLAEIVAQAPALNFNRRLAAEPERAAEDLWGFCAGCYYAEICRGGCSWTAHVFFGKRGNNPYCHHRALEHAARGLQERLVRVEAPPGMPFDHGRFAIELVPLEHSPSGSPS